MRKLLLSTISILAIPVILCGIFVSCGQGGKKSAENKEANTQNIHSTSSEDFIKDADPDATWKMLLQDYQGIWGDTTYLNNLRRYNSLCKAEELASNLYVHLRVKDTMVFLDRVSSMEEDFFDRETYGVRLINKETILLVNEKNGVVQTFKPIEGIHARYNMELMWFSGTYQIYNSEDFPIGIWEFDQEGNIRGGEYNRYGPIGSHFNDDYFPLYSAPSSNLPSLQLILKYDGNNTFSCYEIASLDNPDYFDEPFEKGELKLKLQKIEDKDSDWVNILQNYQGIWADYRYLEVLNKHSSIAKAEAIFLGPNHGHLIVDLRINKYGIWYDSPFGMEPYPLFIKDYKIKTVDEETLLVSGKQVEGEQIFKRVPYKEDLNSSPYYPYSIQFKYVITKMQRLWFAGSYQMLNEEGAMICELTFDEHGKLSGYEDFIHYEFGTDWNSQDYILFSVDNNWKTREYLLLEYNDGSKTFSCFEIEDFDNFEEPFVKKGFKFVLKKM